MSASHLLLALAVVFVWGTDFVMIRWGLDGLPAWKLGAALLVLSGLAVIVLWPRLQARLRV